MSTLLRLNEYIALVAKAPVAGFRADVTAHRTDPTWRCNTHIYDLYQLVTHAQYAYRSIS